MHQQNHIDINDPKVQKRLRTKYNLIRELAETEETFNLDLSVISDVYANTLTKPPYLHYASAPDVRALFSNVKQVLVLSRRFVSHLKECVPAYILYECEPKDGEILKDVRSYIGEVIPEYIPNLEAVYRVYCKQSQFQLNTFYRLDTLGPPMIQTWLHDCRELSKDFTQAWTLDALLIKPVQRLMKYHLLITSMLEATTADHPDYPALKKGLDKMQEAANKINALEPVNMYVYQKKMDSLYDEDDSYKDDGTILTKVDYNTAMSRLKDYPRIDEELEVLIVQFDRKHRHVKNLMKYLRENIEQIQNHFDANSSFAHAWSTWGADDNKRSKVYKKFALSPFRSQHPHQPASLPINFSTRLRIMYCPHCRKCTSTTIRRRTRSYFTIVHTRRTSATQNGASWLRVLMISQSCLPRCWQMRMRLCCHTTCSRLNFQSFSAALNVSLMHLLCDLFQSSATGSALLLTRLPMCLGLH